MAWIIGIDEAGYGSNLGPFVMSAVGWRPGFFPPLLQTSGTAWTKPSARAKDATTAGSSSTTPRWSTPGHADSAPRTRHPRSPGPRPRPPAPWRSCSPWLPPTLPRNWPRNSGTPGQVLSHSTPPRLATRPERFLRACSSADIDSFQARSQLVCPRRFNRLCDAAGSKAAVPAYALSRLLEDWLAIPGDEPIHLYIDKQGGRNSYTTQIQNGLPRGLVTPIIEGTERSTYLVAGLGREVRLTLRPRRRTGTSASPWVRCSASTSANGASANSTPTGSATCLT